MNRRIAAAAAVVALAVTACGGDDDDDSSGTVTVATELAGSTTGAGTAGEFTEEDYVQAGVDNLQLGDDEVERCLTQATIDGIGFDEILATGLSPTELFAQPLTENGLSVPEDRQDAVKETVAGCGDLVELYAERGATSEAESACVREHLTNELVGEIFVVILASTEPSDELQEASDQLDACIADAG